MIRTMNTAVNATQDAVGWTLATGTWAVALVGVPPALATAWVVRSALAPARSLQRMLDDDA